jgi:hypothetical protein
LAKFFPVGRKKGKEQIPILVGGIDRFHAAMIEKPNKIVNKTS